MRKITILLLSLCLVASGALVSCKSVKKVTATTVNQLKSPFKGADYLTTKDFLRVANFGTNANLATAKKLAVANAKVQLSNVLQSTVQKAVENYLSKKKINNPQMTKRLTELVSQGVENAVAKARKTGEKTITNSDGSNYTNWVAMEIPTASLMEAISMKVVEDNNFKTNFDLGIFKSTFVNEVMKNLP